MERYRERLFQHRRYALIAAIMGGVLVLGIAIVLTTVSTGAGTSPDPTQAFPALDREASAEDELPDTAGELVESDLMGIRPETARLLAQSDTARYYLAESERDAVCLVYASSDKEPSAGCTDARKAIDEGVFLGVSTEGEPTNYAVALPQGYDKVVAEGGEPVGDVHDQLFTLTLPEKDVDPPSTLTVRGPAGEFKLELPRLGS